MEEGRSLLDHAALVLDLERLLKRPVDVASERGLRRVVRKDVLKDAVAL
jgi:predicted nucleotidyltransferase